LKKPEEVEFYPKIDYGSSQIDDLNFDELNRHYKEKAKKKWNYLSSKILNEDKDKFRTFLSVINDKLYSNITNIGKCYYYHKLADAEEKSEFKSTLTKKNVNKLKKVFRNRKIASSHLNTGLAMLKDKVVSTTKSNRVFSTVDIRSNYKDDLVSPLMKISRGMIEVDHIKKKRKMSQPNSKRFVSFSRYIDPSNIQNTYRNIESGHARVRVK
jgi:hypothetical protein